MQWVMGAVAASAFVPGATAQEVGRTSAPQELASRQPPPIFPGGYGGDPKMVHVYKPGEPVRALENPGRLSGDPVLPGFVLDLRPIWEPGF